MNYDVKDTVKIAIVDLYKMNENARNLFDLNAKRERDASSTSIDSLTWKLKISRGEAVALARDLESAGCGEFKNGRRGSPSRLEWAYSCILLGKAAAGEQVQLEEPEDPQDEDFEIVSDIGDAGLTISEAKSAIAVRLGIAPSQIEITIKA